MELSSSTITVLEVTVPEVREISHLSSVTSDQFWTNDNNGNIIQSNMEGNILQKLNIRSSGARCVHAVTMRGELLYTDIRERSVCRLKSDKTTEILIYTEEWKPRVIYSSHINGHIFLGMIRDYTNNMKITRYSRKGRKLQDISMDDNRQTLPLGLFYITENINGDICTSELRHVVVMTGSGTKKFSYSGHRSQSKFRPYGLCTDVLGHILVCNGGDQYIKNHESVHLLDKDGQFISFILTPDQCPHKPHALCVDDQQNLWVGFENSSTVKVYKYLQLKHKQNFV